MGLRTGKQYLAGLRDGRKIIYEGRLIEDVTEEPVFRRHAAAVAQFYDFQSRPELRDLMTYETEDGERAAIAFLDPRSKEDLRRRAAAHAAWAEVTCGLMARSPDYMNAMLASFDGLWARSVGAEKEAAKPLRDLYLKARRADHYFTHTFVYPFKSSDAGRMLESPTVMRVVRETPDGIVVSGARGIATGAPFADRNFNFEHFRPPPPGKPPGADGHVLSLWFANPVNAPGLRWICRDVEARERSHFDAPLSGVADEVDAIAVFDEVLLPWDDIAAYARDFASLATAAQIFAPWGEELSKHHALIRSVAKTRFILGLGHLMAESSQSSQFINVQQRLGDIVLSLDLLESLAISAVEDAEVDPASGLCYPNKRYVSAGVRYFGEACPRLLDHLLTIGASRFVSSPQERTLEALGSAIEGYFRGSSTSARENVALYRLAWDVAGTSFGSRGSLYERFFSGDPDRQRAGAYMNMDKSDAIAMVRRMLKACPTAEEPFSLPDRFARVEPGDGGR
jgi:aromatic ring hydroxylase